MKKILFIILSLAVIGGMAWYIDKNYLAPTKVSPTTMSTNETIPQPTQSNLEENKLTTEKLILATQTDKGKEIIFIDANGENQKVLFTDANEEQKIKKIASLALTSREASLISGDNSLAAVKLDGSGKYETLIESFGNPSGVSLSPDGTSISFVAFSNVEIDYGYTLYLSSRTGANLRGLVRDEREIKNPIWSADNQKIYYLQNMGNETAIMKVATETGRPQSIYQTGENIYSLGLTGGELIFSQGPSGKTESSIYKMADSGNPQKILVENGIIYYPSISSDSLNIAYLLSVDVVNEPSGEIWVASADGKTKKSLTKGIKILGWIP